MDRLDRAAREAWRRYTSVGALPHALLRPNTYRAWERCHELRVDPTRPRAEALSTIDTERLLGRRADLIRAARPYMLALSRAAGGLRHAAMIADEGGALLALAGDAETETDPNFPSAGSLLAEEIAGANGVGTTLAGRCYVELVGPEHFIGGFHAFTCQGVPLLDSDRVVGVLSTSVREVAASESLHGILLVASQGVEAELARERLEHAVRGLEAADPLEARRFDALRQDVIQALSAARVRVASAARASVPERVDARVRTLALAQRELETFKRRADLCLDLVAADEGEVRPLVVDQVVRGVVDLLETELSVRGVGITLAAGEPAVLVRGEKVLRKEVFRVLLEALEAAPTGSEVVARLAATAEPPGLELRLVLATAPTGARPLARHFWALGDSRRGVAG